MAADTRTRAREPRELAVDEDAFGRTDVIEWAPVQSGKTENFVALVAAQLQHHYAVAIRQRLREQDMAVKDYASANFLPYDRLTKVLRGAVVMSLEDIARAELLLGGGVLKLEVVQSAKESIRRAATSLRGRDSPHG